MALAVDPTTDYESYTSMPESVGMMYRLRRNLTGLTGYDILEVMFAASVFFGSYVVTFFWQTGFDWERPLPYQVLDDGEVVLDLSLSYPRRQNTVSSQMLVWSCVVLPIALTVAGGLVLGRRYDAKSALCVSLVAFGLNFLVTHTMKVYCGRFRPNFYEMCQFSEDTLQCASESSGAVANSHHSFPSGHSSTAFTGMTVLSLTMLGKASVHGNDITSMAHLVKKKVLGVLAVLPMLFATFVAASRVHDFMHHPSDVAVGAAIGFACASFAYSLWYPSVYCVNNAGIPLQLVHEQKFTGETQGLLSAYGTNASPSVSTMVSRGQLA